MPIVAHWVDTEFQLDVVLLDLHWLIDPHTGKNQAVYFWSMIVRYEIEHKVGKFNIDNTRNNDTALQENAQIMQP